MGSAPWAPAQARGFSSAAADGGVSPGDAGGADGSAEGSSPPAPGGDAPEEAVPEGPKERLRRRERYGTYEDDIEQEVMEGAWEVTDEEGNPYFNHLYDARAEIDEWIHDPTFLGMLAASPEEMGGGLLVDPLGELAEKKYAEEDGPELRWETRLVLGPGGSAWHPANRKVKVSVYVRELGLTPLAKERLLALVGRRYNRNKDELTIVSERYAAREENRKDVLRTLLSIIEEAKRADELAAEENASFEELSGASSSQ